MIKLSPAAPQRHESLTVYPLLSPDGGALVCVLLPDAIRAGTLRITEVGQGVIDFKTVFAKAPARAIKHYFVEQDTTPGSPFDSIKISIDYLKKLEF